MATNTIPLSDIDLPYVRLAGGSAPPGAQTAHPAEVPDYDTLLRALAGWLVVQRRPLDADEQRFVRRVAKLTPEELREVLDLPGYVRQEATSHLAFASDADADRALRLLALAALEPGSSPATLAARVDTLLGDARSTPDRRPTTLLVARNPAGWQVQSAAP